MNHVLINKLRKLIKKPIQKNNKKQIKKPIPPLNVWNKKIKLMHKQSNSHEHINIHNNHIVLHKLQLNQTTSTNKMKFPPSYSIASALSIPIPDQGNLGACVTFAILSVKASYYPTMPSPSYLYSYYCARLATGCSPTQDTGLDLLQCAYSDCFNKYGITSSNYWSYNTRQFKVQPPLLAYQNASTTYPLNSKSIPQTDISIKTALYSNQIVLCGILVYPSFMTDKVASNGIIPTPLSSEKSIGGHCIRIIGFTIWQQQDYYIIANSWGLDWGSDGNTTIQPNFKNNGSNGGYGYIPSAYLLNPKNAFEFITCSST